MEMGSGSSNRSLEAGLRASRWAACGLSHLLERNMNAAGGTGRIPAITSQHLLKQQLHAFAL